EKISARAQEKLNQFLWPLISGKKLIFTWNNVYEAIWSALIFWLVPVFPILYLVFGRLFMAKIMFSNKDCVSCGRCAKFCSNHAIEMKSLFGKKRPFWTYHCENCLRCMGFCKKKAIEAGHSWAIVLFFITSVPVMAWILALLNRTFDYFPKVSNHWMMTLLDMIYFLPALMLSYLIFWYLIHIPAINFFFSTTTLTHYYRRFHEPATRLKDLINKK
ncbi:MAG: hypothetical protein KKE61_02160, partial [Proteobacteria bacterium]|nr:hypothetical protein [Pseudomonadota bacterium]